MRLASPGLIIMAMIYGLDKISGAYFNPAISTGFTISKHLKLRDLPLYILVQIFGSIIASLTVLLVIGQSGNSGLTLPHEDVTWYRAFILEIVLTFCANARQHINEGRKVQRLQKFWRNSDRGNDYSSRYRRNANFRGFDESGTFFWTSAYTWKFDL